MESEKDGVDYGEGKDMDFRVIKTTKESFRTVSSCFLKQVEELLQENELNEKYGLF